MAAIAFISSTTVPLKHVSSVARNDQRPLKCATTVPSGSCSAVGFCGSFISKSPRGRGAKLAARKAVKVQASADLFAQSGGDSFLSAGQKAELEAVAAAIAQPGKGITACDEGPATIGSRFEAVGIANSEETRRAYRQMLFEAPGASNYLSAAILDPETVYQKSSTSGKLFPAVLSELGIVPGIKPHLKVYEIPGQAGSTVMQGLDSLAQRCREYRAAGIKFAKWRSPLVIDVAAGQPSTLIIEMNMLDLARYALICQSEGLVPIVEPDVSLSGAHTLEQAVAINTKIQSTLFKAMLDHGVYMEGAVLKSNIVNPGKRCTESYTAEQIGQANLDVFRRCFPTAIKTANFLSGGQSLYDAAGRLNAMNKLKTARDPWNLSFSWSAALQMPLFELCKGTGQLQLEAMSKLYVEELKIASASALGQLATAPGQGGHPSTSPSHASPNTFTPATSNATTPVVAAAGQDYSGLSPSQIEFMQRRNRRQ